jgi:hypothetical protein
MMPLIIQAKRIADPFADVGKSKGSNLQLDSSSDDESITKPRATQSAPDATAKTIPSLPDNAKTSVKSSAASSATATSKLSDSLDGSTSSLLNINLQAITKDSASTSTSTNAMKSSSSVTSLQDIKGGKSALQNNLDDSTSGLGASLSNLAGLPALDSPRNRPAEDIQRFSARALEKEKEKDKEKEREKEKEKNASARLSNGPPPLRRKKAYDFDSDDDDELDIRGIVKVSDQIPTAKFSNQSSPATSQKAAATTTTTTTSAGTTTTAAASTKTVAPQVPPLNLTARDSPRLSVDTTHGATSAAFMPPPAPQAPPAVTVSNVPMTSKASAIGFGDRRFSHNNAGNEDMLDTSASSVQLGSSPPTRRLSGGDRGPAAGLSININTPHHGTNTSAHIAAHSMSMSHATPHHLAHVDTANNMDLSGLDSSLNMPRTSRAGDAALRKVQMELETTKLQGEAIER